MPGGRPTKYKREYCKQLINHMKEGLSFETFAALINVNTQTIYNWTYDYEEFFEAKQLGINESKLFWEKMGVEGAGGKLKNFNYGCWFRNMANRFPDQWRDKIEITAKDETLKDPSLMSDSELDDRLNHALKVLEKYDKNGNGSSIKVDTRKTKAIRPGKTNRKS